MFDKNKINEYKSIHYQLLFYAQIATYRAIIDGKIIRKPCEVCGETEKVHAHHDDYMKPLNVRWLCNKHHRQHHTNIRKKLAKKYNWSTITKNWDKPEYYSIKVWDDQLVEKIITDFSKLMFRGGKSKVLKRIRKTDTSNFIDNLRTQYNLTYKKLAKKLGISQIYLQKIANANCGIPESLKYRIEYFYGINRFGIK